MTDEHAEPVSVVVDDEHQADDERKPAMPPEVTTCPHCGSHNLYEVELEYAGSTGFRPDVYGRVPEVGDSIVSCAECASFVTLGEPQEDDEEPATTPQEPPSGEPTAEPAPAPASPQWPLQEPANTSPITTAAGPAVVDPTEGGTS